MLDVSVWSFFKILLPNLLFAMLPRIELIKKKENDYFDSKFVFLMIALPLQF